MATEQDRSCHVLVIGGSYAGLAAALQLARARRDVVVVDSGQPRNRMASSSHGFLGHDGYAPAAIRDQAGSQLRAYRTVRWINALVAQVHGDAGAWTAATTSGTTITAQRLVLALGVADELPAIPGIAERWGRTVFHCPYCHGYELDEGRIGVISSSTLAFHQAMLLPDWGRVTLFTNGCYEPDENERVRLASRNVAVETTRIAAIIGDADVQLEDGRLVALEGLFTAPRTRPASDIASRLGCRLEEGPMGPFISADATRETSVQGVFACGDAARAAGNVALAVGDGTVAGVAAHQSLVFRR